MKDKVLFLVIFMFAGMALAQSGQVPSTPTGNPPQTPITYNPPKAPTTVNTPTMPATVEPPTGPTTVDRPTMPTTNNGPPTPTGDRLLVTPMINNGPPTPMTNNSLATPTTGTLFFATKQKAIQDFNTFFATFKTAVKQKNTGTLASLMSPRFDFISATNVAPADVFRGLDSNAGQQWLNLQQAVQGTPVTYAESGPYKNSRVLKCTPNQVIYNCLVIFNKDSQNRWRWRAMVMPTR